MSDSPVLDSTNALRAMLSASNATHAQNILSSVMAETLGMSMHNAVTAQHNAQMLNAAAM